MNPEALNEDLSREPFIPLRLTLTTGETIDIRDPGGTFINHLALYIFEVRRGGDHIVDRSRLISLRHIVQVEQLATAG